MAEEIPVYLFTGFMDSGKTTLVQETLFENEFANGSKGLIIMCEDGEYAVFAGAGIYRIQRNVGY